jgi:hypothetical protein
MLLEKRNAKYVEIMKILMLSIGDDETFTCLKLQFIFKYAEIRDFCHLSGSVQVLRQKHLGPDCA